MKILHLYYDIMNLYGEYANVSALKRMLEKNGVLCEVDTLSVGDELRLMEYDVVYVGSGTESNQKYVLTHLEQQKQELQKYIESGKFLLMTGNAFEILGKEITTADGKVIKGLDIFSYTVSEQDKTRETGDAVFLMEGLEQPLVGFINKCSAIHGIEAPLFTVQMGMGNEPGKNGEGIHYKNFYGTHLTGPLLIKNPYFLMDFAAKLCDSKMDGSYLTYEKAGYEVTLQKLKKRQEGK